MGVSIMALRLAGPLLVMLGASSAPSSMIFAQVRASERSTISQTVDGTTLTIDYARPRGRGRDSLFGGEVKWGEVWTPGANMATTLETSANLKINGHQVAKGKYSVWMVVNRGDWTLVLDTVAKIFHTVRPPVRDGQIRFDFKPETRPKMEVLTWSFPDVRSDGMTLAMQWDTVYVALRVQVTPSHPITIEANLAPRYLGRYEMRWVQPESEAPSEADTSQHAETAESAGPGSDDGPIRLDVSYEKGSLWARVDPAPFPGYDFMVLIPIKEDWFIAGWWKDGELYDVSDEMVMEFKLERGRATGFDMRMQNDELMATAQKKQ